MDAEDAFLYTYFTHLSQSCYDKAKEHVEKNKEENQTNGPPMLWNNFLYFLLQLAMAEKSYMNLGFLQNKNKGFLRKDNSLRSGYETMKTELRKIEDNCKSSDQDRRLQNYCQNIFQYLNARVNMIDLYEKIYLMGVNRHLLFNETSKIIEDLIKTHTLEFADISLTPIKAVFSMEIEILDQLFKALVELQKLQFLPSLALIHGAHTRLVAWETKIQNRETWKLGLFKKESLSALFQWLQKFKGTVLSKFSLYFHDTLAQQTTHGEMRHLCSKLYHDHYQKIFNFQKKYEAACVILLSDHQVICDTADYDSFPIIVSYPPRSPPQLETILKMISETAEDLANFEKIIYKYSTDGKCSYILTTVEPNIYLVILFENKKSEKDVYIANFITDLCTNLRCTKLFTHLKNVVK